MPDISKAVPKLDEEEKMSGRAVYVDDIDIPGMYFARTVRSTVAKGRIVKIDVPKLPKDYHIIDHTDIPAKNVVKMIFDDWPVFAEEKVTHIGDPIMLVVGKDRAVIDDICENIAIEYAEEEPVFDFRDSAVDYRFEKGDAKKAFERTARHIEYTYRTGYQEQAYIEPQGFVAYREQGRITLIGSIQCPYYVKNAVLDTLGCGEDDVRVKQAVVGGAFGGKEEYPSVMACQLAVAVKKLNVPIKLVFGREEDMEVTTKRHPSTITLRAAIAEDNTVAALDAHIKLDGGAYLGLSNVVLSRSMLAVTAAYTIENLNVAGDVYLTNTVPNGAFRGFGAPQMIYAIEMFMHHIAKDLGEDVLEFRLKHLAKQGDMTATSGHFHEPIIMPALIERAMEMSDYRRKASTYAKDESNHGIGMSWFFHGCGFTGSGEADHIKAEVKLEKDIEDKVHIHVAAVDMGQGSKTTLAKVVAETLGIPLADVVIDNPDTDFVPDSGPTVASRTAMVVGGLLARAGQRLKSEWVSGETVVVIEKYKQPDHIRWDDEKFHGDAYPAYSWGVNVVEVEVDPHTYEVRVENVTSAYDGGKALDERIVLGQADGGIAQGVAYGYLEVMEHDKGKLKQRNLTDYMIPTAVDTAPTRTYLFDNPYALGPFGAKGFGELTLVGGAPALALAVEMAIGRKVTKIPVTPEVIMELMKHGKH